MSDSIVSELEHLSAELLIEIFEYLTPQELYRSFAHINTGLNLILKSQPKLILVTNTHLDPVLSFFDSFMAVRLHFSHSSQPRLSQYNFSNFIGIRSFDIRVLNSYKFCRIEPIEQFNRIIHPDLCPRLESLRLPFCSVTLIDLIFTGAFPHLKRFHVGQRTTIVLPSPIITSLPGLRQLALKGQNGNEFQKIFSICPNLSSLTFYVNDTFVSCALPTRRYPLMKYLRLWRIRDFVFYDRRFESLLSLFPNLVRFDLTVDQDRRYGEIIDFAQIAVYLRQYLPRLAILNWEIYLTEYNQYSLYEAEFQIIAQMHRLFKCFGKCQWLLRIASYNFLAKCYYHRRFIRPSSE